MMSDGMAYLGHFGAVLELDDIDGFKFRILLLPSSGNTTKILFKE